MPLFYDFYALASLENGHAIGKKSFKARYVIIAQQPKQKVGFSVKNNASGSSFPVTWLTLIIT